MAVFSAQCQASEASKIMNQNLDNGEITLRVPCCGDQFELLILQISKVIVIGKVFSYNSY